MKSHFFAQNTIDDIEDKFVIFECSDKVFNAIIEWFDSQKTLPRMENTLIKKIHETTGEVNVELLNNVISEIYNLLKLSSTSQINSSENQKEIENFYVDFKEIFAEKFEKFENFVERLEKIKSLSLKYINLFKIKFTQQKGAPSLIRSIHSVALKPIFNKEFEYDEMAINDYAPELITFVPVVMFDLTTSNEDNLTFQLDMDNFDRFLNDLIALKVQLQEVDKKWNN